MPEGPDSLEFLLNVAKSAAIDAGKAILELYQEGNFKSYQKEDESPVTSADYKANEIIMAHLQKHTPDIPILSEETQHASLSERSLWTKYWLIDPIDGTQEFIARSGDFAVNIAMIENNKPVIGVIYWPVGETIYYASKDHGAFKDSPEFSGKIQVRQFDDPQEDEVVLAVSRRQAPNKVLSRMSTSRQYREVPLGSCALKACIIAEGKADAFMRLGVTGEWDTGAPQCIVSEAGGSILAANLEPLTYNMRDSLENPDFVVLGDQRVPWNEVVQYHQGE